MIYDAGNLFLKEKAASTYGTTPAASDNVVANTGGGNAYEAPWLVVLVTGAATAGGNLTILDETVTHPASLTLESAWIDGGSHDAEDVYVP